MTRLLGVGAAAAGLLWAAPACADDPPSPSGVPAAMVNGQRVEWSDLVPALVEAAGGVVLEEAVLDRALKAEAERLGVRIGTMEVDAEHDQLARTLAEAAGVDEAEGAALIARVREARGLGERRFAGLLTRNALLRAVVRSGLGTERVAAVTEEDVRQAHALKYGSRVRIRMLLVRTAAEAAGAVRRIKGGESFAEVAAAVSIDPSAVRGGSIVPFSLEDSTYPVAIRRVLAGMEPGAISEAVEVSWADQTGFAVVRLEERVAAPAGAPGIEAAAEDLRAEVRLVRERAAMDRLARRLIAEAKVTIFDRSLDKSWQRQGEAR